LQQGIDNIYTIVLQQGIDNIYTKLQQSGIVDQSKYKEHITALGNGFEEHQNDNLISIKDRFLSGTPETNSIYEKCKELFKNNKLGLVYKNKNKNDKVQIIVNNALTESVSDVDKVKGIYVFAIVVSAAKPNKQTMGEYMSVSQFRKTASGPNASEYQDLAANGGYIEPHIPGSEYLAVGSAQQTSNYQEPTITYATNQKQNNRGLGVYGTPPNVIGAPPARQARQSRLAAAKTAKPMHSHLPPANNYGLQFNNQQSGATA
jgi:hypothetical protein